MKKSFISIICILLIGCATKESKPIVGIKETNQHSITTLHKDIPPIAIIKSNKDGTYSYTLCQPTDHECKNNVLAINLSTGLPSNTSLTRWDDYSVLCSYGNCNLGDYAVGSNTTLRGKSTLNGYTHNHTFEKLEKDLTESGFYTLKVDIKETTKINLIPFMALAAPVHKVFELNRSELQEAINTLISNETLKSQYKSLVEAKIQQQEISNAKAQEQNRLAQIERNKKRLEEEKQMQLRRESAMKSISKKENIGRKICKNGDLKYTYYTGYLLQGQPQYKDTIEPGQLQAYLEGYSQDGYRIQIRVSNWATSNGKLRFNPVQQPRIGDITAEPSTVHWDDVKDWFTCF